jgi:hypothetical protein
MIAVPLLDMLRRRQGDPGNAHADVRGPPPIGPVQPRANGSNACHLRLVARGGPELPIQATVQV